MRTEPQPEQVMGSILEPVIAQSGAAVGSSDLLGVTLIALLIYSVYHFPISSIPELIYWGARIMWLSFRLETLKCLRYLKGKLRFMLGCFLEWVVWGLKLHCKSCDYLNLLFVHVHKFRAAVTPNV